MMWRSAVTSEQAQAEPVYLRGHYLQAAIFIGALCLMLTLSWMISSAWRNPTGFERGLSSTIGTFTHVFLFPIGLSILLLVLLFGDVSVSKWNLIASCWLTVVLMLPQFGSITPIGPDGWMFTDLSYRFSQHGIEPKIHNYLGRPGVLLLTFFGWYISPLFGFFLSSLSGVMLTSFFSYHVLKLLAFEREIYSPQVRLLLVMTIVLIGWIGHTIFPFAMYSAQMLGLLLTFACFNIIALRDRQQRTTTSTGVVFLGCLMIFTHIQSTLLLLSFLAIRVVLGSRTNRADLTALSTLTLAFILYNALVVPNTLSEQIVFSPFFFLIFSIIATLIALGMNRFLHTSIAHDIEIHLIVWMLSVIVLNIALTFLLDTLSFLYRIPLFATIITSFVLLNNSFSQHGSKIWKSLSPFSNPSLASLIVITVLLSSLTTYAVVKRTERVIVFPPSTLDCWEMMKDAGVYGIINGTTERYMLVTSPHLIVPIPDEVFNDLRVDRLGEADDWPLATIGAVLETGDLKHKAASTENGIFWNTWVLTDEIHSACRLYIHPSVVDELEPGVWPAEWGPL